MYSKNHKFYCSNFELDVSGHYCANCGVMLSADEDPFFYCVLDAERRNSIVGKACPAHGDASIISFTVQLSLFS